MAQDQPIDFLSKFLMNMMVNDAPIYKEEANAPNTKFGFARGGNIYGRLPIEQFGSLPPGHQSEYIKYMQQAPNAAFAKLWPETIRDPQGQGLTTEMIDSLLRPYLDVQRTGLPQGY